ncbi:MAG: hypothetical protein NVS9B15_14110 [Acidobacteriaceae bacterium]
MKEGKVYRNQQGLPLEIGQFEATEISNAARDTEVMRTCLSAEDHGAGIARADDLALFRMKQMLMQRSKLRAAQLTPLGSV